MKRRRLAQGILEFIIVLLLLAGCVNLDASPKPTSIATLKPTDASTFTPDPCTGWWCTVTGVVYDDTADLGNELEGVTVTLVQNSNCSPTRGQHQTTTDIDGRFEFNDIFFHDTDRIQIQASYEGENSMLWDSADFYCYYCSCFGSPLEIVLRETPSP
jgi:hypothetical protein